MILEADKNNSISTGIISIDTYKDSLCIKTRIMFVNVSLIKTAYQQKSSNYNKVIINFIDTSYIEVYLNTNVDADVYANKLLNHIFKMKMLGTKWEYENPEKYI